MQFDANSIMKSYLTDTLPLEDMLYVKGKVAIVTGGTSGLGFCVAQRLLQGGAKVVISGSTAQKGTTALSLLRDAGFQDVEFCQADLCKEADVENLVDFTVKTYKTVDILVTSGGSWSFAHIYDLPEEDFIKTLDTNLVGAYRCVKHVSRFMVDNSVHGKIVLVSSNVAFLPQPVFGGYAHYAASKGGVVSMTTEIAKELKRFGIMVNTVAPGAMWTPGCLGNGTVKSLPSKKQAKMTEELAVCGNDGIPTADSVAIVIYGMCTRMADGVTGECIVADSGMMRNIMAFQPAIQQYPPVE